MNTPSASDLGLRSICVQQKELETGSPKNMFVVKLAKLQSDCRKQGQQIVGILQSFLIPKTLEETQLIHWNSELGDAYRETGILVLGGDISDGKEFQIFITAVVQGADT